MAKSCSIIPTVEFTDKDGNVSIQDSPLFRELLDFFGKQNREIVKKSYVEFKSQDFLTDNKRRLTFYKDTTEPTLASIRRIVDLFNIIPSDKLLEALESQILTKDAEGNPIKYKSINIPYMKVLQFNSNSLYKEQYLAHLKKTFNKDTGSVEYIIEIVPNTPDNYDIALQQQEDQVLLNNLIKILNQNGIEVEIDSLVDKTIDSPYQLSKAEQATDGIIQVLTLSDDPESTTTLFEGIGEFMFSAISGDYKTRLTAIASNKEIQSFFFNEETLEALSEEEATNKTAYLIIEDILNKKSTKVTTKYHTFFGKIYGFFKRLFSVIPKTELEKLYPDDYTAFSKYVDYVLNTSNTLDKNNPLHKEAYAQKTGVSVAFQKLIGSFKTEINVLQNIYNKSNFIGFAEEQKVALEKLADSTKSELDILKDEVIPVLETSGLQLDMAATELGNLKDIQDEWGKKTKTNPNLTMSLKNIDAIINRILQTKAVIDAVKTVSTHLTELINDLTKEVSRIEDTSENTELIAKYKDVIDSLTKLRSALLDQAMKVETAALTQLKYYYPERIKTTMGIKFMEDGKLLHNENFFRNVFESLDKDISWWQSKITPGAQSSDALVQFADRVFKDTFMEATMATYKDAEQLDMAYKTLDGHTNFGAWAVEKDEDGKPTGFIISPYLWGKFLKADRDFKDSLIHKYERRKPDAPRPKGIESWWENPVAKAEYTTWRKNNTQAIRTSTGELIEYVPNPAIYGNPKYAELTPKELTFLKSYMQIKASIDRELPKGATNKYLLPQVSSDFIENFKQGKFTRSLKMLNKKSWTTDEEYKDSLGLPEITKADNKSKFNFINLSKYHKKDFQDDPISSIPMFYTKRLKDPSEISLDIVTSMKAYSKMGRNYAAMTKAVDVLEGAKLFMTTRRYNSDKVSSNVNTVTTKDRVYKMLSDYINRNAYNIREDQLAWKNKSVNKAVNNVAALSSTITLGFNINNMIRNIQTSLNTLWRHAIAKDLVNKSDIAYATKQYVLLNFDPNKVVDSMRNSPSSKLNLFRRLYNIDMDYGQDLLEAHIEDKGARFARDFSPFMLQKQGAKFINTLAFLALSHKHKLKLNGEDVNLIDAYEVIVVNGIRVLKLKEGVTKPDGTPFKNTGELKEYEANLVKELHRQHTRLALEMNGAFNSIDKPALYNSMIGKILMLQKLWVIGQFDKAYSGSRFKIDNQQWEHGYWTSFAYTFLALNGLRKGKFWERISTLAKERDENGIPVGADVAASDALKAHVKANLTSGAFQMVNSLLHYSIYPYLLLSSRYMLLSAALGGDDDPDNDYTVDMLRDMERKDIKELEKSLDGWEKALYNFLGYAYYTSKMGSIELISLTPLESMREFADVTGIFGSDTPAFIGINVPLGIMTHFITGERYKSGHPISRIEKAEVEGEEDVELFLYSTKVSKEDDGLVYDNNDNKFGTTLHEGDYDPRNEVWAPSGQAPDGYVLVQEKKYIGKLKQLNPWTRFYKTFEDGPKEWEKREAIIATKN